MRKWRSHKVVEAEEIAAVEIDRGNIKAAGGRIAVRGGEVIHVPGGFFARNTPTEGDFLVRYPDGYLSWSPRRQFEEGYSEVGPDGGQYTDKGYARPINSPAEHAQPLNDAGNGGYENATGSRYTR
jgi:hypothetical protein